MTPVRTVSAQGASTISIDASQRFQRIDGFGVNANSASWNNGELKPAIDMLIDQMGSSLWRVVIDNGDWETPNDNSDPNVFNWDYYNVVYTSPKFEELWSTIAYLNQRGITSGLLLNVMGPVADWMGEARSSRALKMSTVEMIASMVHYGSVTRGLQIGMLSPINEPELDGIEGPRLDEIQYARVLRKLAAKLDSVGLGSVRFVAPETGNIGRGVGLYLPELLDDPTLMAKIDHIGLHDYNGNAGGAESAIRLSSYPEKNFWITEVTTIGDILPVVAQGAAGVLVWDGFDSVYNHAILAGRGTVPPNDAGDALAPLAYNRTTGTYSPRKIFYETAQLFRFVPPGSFRVGATVAGTGLTAISFFSESAGRFTIVGRNTSTGSRTISGTLGGLPAISSLEFYQTTSSVNLQRGTDVPVFDRAFSLQVAGGSTFTLTATTTPDVIPPSVSIVQPLGGSVSGNVIVSAQSSDNVGTAGVQFFLDEVPLAAEDTANPYEVLWNTASATPGEHQLTAKARDAAGNSSSSTPVFVTVEPRPTDTVSPSVDVTSPPQGSIIVGTTTLAAVAADNVGVAGVQFLLDGAPLGVEDTAPPYSQSWNTNTAPNGTHVISARARDAANNTTTAPGVNVTIANTAPTSLVAAFGFEEGTGTSTVDASGRNNTASIVGATWTTVGRFGKALSFDGTNDLLTVADATSLDLTTGMTLEAWVRPTTSGSWRSVILKEAGAGLAYALYGTDQSLRPAGYINVTTDVAASASAVLTANTWTHLTVTYDGATLRIFVNGAAAGSLARTGSMTTSSSPLRIGGNSVWGEYFAGIIDEVRIYSRALTAPEILHDMNTPVASGGLAEPSAQITAPSAGDTVSGHVAVTATASDAAGVAGVQFTVDGVAVGAEDTVSPYSLNWDTTQSTNGPHALTAVVRSNVGATATSSVVAITVANGDTSAPTVSISSPANGSTVSATVTLSASASDNIGVAGVQFLVDGAPIGSEDTVAPFAVNWNGPSGADGIYTVAARARDAAGNATTSTAVSVTVQNADVVPPIVSVTSPANGATLSGSISVVASASDAGGIVGVQFYVDGVPPVAKTFAAPYSISWNSISVANGTHSIAARARDAAGNATTSATIVVSVSNGNTSTANDRRHRSISWRHSYSGVVTISASASDNVAIAGVLFLVNGAPLGAEDTSAPFSISWPTMNLTNGQHTVSARARDAAGNQTTSSLVTVNVVNSTPPVSSLVAAYGFEEASGSAALDASGRGHTGSISGATRSTAGRFGRALSFDGINDLVTIADTTALDLTTGITLEAWVRPSSTSSWRTVLLKETSTGLSYYPSTRRTATLVRRLHPAIERHCCTGEHRAHGQCVDTPSRYL